MTCYENLRLDDLLNWTFGIKQYPTSSSLFTRLTPSFNVVEDWVYYYRINNMTSDKKKLGRELRKGKGYFYEFR